MPKQFVSLIGQDSTFNQVMRRVSDPELFGRPIVITHSEFRFVVAEQLRECDISAEIVLEPVRRDSGPAVAVAAALATKRDGDALALVLAADHVIRNELEFRNACREAAETAARGRIVTFGIHPTFAATNYGYIRAGKAMNGGEVREVEAFVEKPDTATASKYIADQYLWNSGNFLFHAATMWREIEQFEPEIAKAAKESVSHSTRDIDFVWLAPEPFARSPKKSIDYAVMERTQRAAVVPVDIGWSDIGSWSAVWDVLDDDTAGNAIEGSVCLSDTTSWARRAPAMISPQFAQWG
jgi:mannose-1-phosphate guanylyltransferase/mannose-6-phosphate isomerase